MTALPLDHVQVRIFEAGERSDYDSGRRDERADVIKLLEGVLRIAEKAHIHIGPDDIERAIRHIRAGIHATTTRLA